MEGGYEDAPGLYMENCSAHNNPGTYRKWVIFWWRAHGWTLSGKRIMPEGVGGPCGRTGPLVRAGFGREINPAARSVDAPRVAGRRWVR